MRALTEWLEIREAPDNEDFQRYTESIANARYVIRRVFRMVDDQARAAGIDPLEHKVLLQVYGFHGETPSISAVAHRLDIVPAFASRLIKGLEQQGLLRRSQLASDRRVTTVEITDKGVALLREIDNSVHLHIRYFQSQMTKRERMDTLVVSAFYVGVEADSMIATALRDEFNNSVPTDRTRARPRHRDGAAP